jgi:hypothetical protein
VKTILAIDPGEEHCGIAVFRAGEKVECVWAGEKKPTDLYDWLDVGVALWARDDLRWDVLVVEEFRLYPAHAKAQAWSRFGTVEVIGVLREWARREGVEVVLQPASAKKVTNAILRKHKVVLKSRGHGSHARDAEVHGWHYLIRQGWAPAPAKP